MRPRDKSDTCPGSDGYRSDIIGLDPDADMSPIEQNDTPDGVEIIWPVTFKTDIINLGGKQMNAGEQVLLGATLISVDGQWLIVSLTDLEE